MKGRKPSGAALKVIPGDFGALSRPEEPDWLLAFPEGSWGPAAAELAAAQWDRVVTHMAAAGTLGAENGAEIEIYAVNYARWRLAEAHVAQHGPIVPAPKTFTPMHNPFLAVANAAAEKVMKTAAALGLPPDMRGRVTKANAQKKRTTAADSYLSGARKA